MPSTPSPIRLAFVAALAAFALGACSGGGGMTTPTAGTMTPAPTPTPTPAPTPSTPTPGDRTDFFPIASEHPEQVTRTERQNVPAGTTLSNLLGEEYTRINFPQFSVFEFGAAVEDKGIPLQKDTATAAGRYAAVAYQAILEHSMFLFQGGVYHFAVQNTAVGRPGGVYFSTGDPTTGPAVAGTWTGKAVGFEWSETAPPGGTGNAIRPTFAINTAQAERRIVKADVEIGVSINNDNENVTWAFTNWTGGSTDYPSFTSQDVREFQSGGSQAVRKTGGQGDHYLVYSDGPVRPTSGLDIVESHRTVGIQFYGPGRQEAGGTFWFKKISANPTTDYTIQGGFAAKKQP